MDQDRKTAVGREALRREARAYGEAGRTLNGWISGARALALLRGALSSGIFDATRAPSTVGEISATIGVEGPRVADVCLALEAHGVFERDGGAYRLSKAFSAARPPGFEPATGGLEVQPIEADRALDQRWYAGVL